MFNFLNIQSSFLKKTKLKVISAYDKRFSKIGKISEKNFKKYANKFSFDCEIYKIKNFNERPPAWYKIKILIDNLENKNYDYILWIDSDAFFCRYENILKYIDKKKDLSLVFHNIKSPKKNNDPHIQNISYSPNTGFMIFKNSDWSKRFLKKIWNEKKYINHPNWDNAAIYSILGLNSELGLKKKNKKNKKIFSKINILPTIWNSVPNRSIMSDQKDNPSLFEFNPVVIHLAGIRRKNRIKFIREFRDLFI